jgi:glutamine synthetase
VDGKPQGQARRGRFPDPSANPYLCFAALLMAGLDGIENKIHPGEPSDKDLYDLPPEELAGIPTVCASACVKRIEALEADHDFLLKGGVFTKDQIEGYMELKWEESTYTVLPEQEAGPAASSRGSGLFYFADQVPAHFPFTQS